MFSGISFHTFHALDWKINQLFWSFWGPSSSELTLLEDSVTKPVTVYRQVQPFNGFKPKNFADEHKYQRDHEQSSASTRGMPKQEPLATILFPLPNSHRCQATVLSFSWLKLFFVDLISLSVHNYLYFSTWHPASLSLCWVINLTAELNRLFAVRENFSRRWGQLTL